MEPDIDNLSNKDEMIPESGEVNSVCIIDESDTPASPNVEEMDLMDEISVTSKNDSLKSPSIECLQVDASSVETHNHNASVDESNDDDLIVDEKCSDNNTNDSNDAHEMKQRQHSTVSESDDKLMIDEKVTDVNYNENDDSVNAETQSSPNSPEQSQSIQSPSPVRHFEQETPESPDIKRAESPVLQEMQIKEKSISPPESPILQEVQIKEKSISPPESPILQEVQMKEKSLSPPESPETSQDPTNNHIVGSPAVVEDDNSHNSSADKDQETPMEVEMEATETKSTPKQADADEKEEEEDLEDGEIEDDEDESGSGPPPKIESTTKETVISFKSIIAKEESEKDKRRHSHSHNKEKEKDKDSRTKDKENKSSDKKRKHGDESSSKRERRGSSSEKSSRKRSRKNDDEVGEIEDDELLLNVRGASPNKSPSGGAGNKFYEEGAFIRHSFDDEEGEFEESQDDRRRRRSRSPLGRRRGPDDRSSSRRPVSGSGRKEPIKPMHKSDQICAYYMQGKCQKSHEECSFSHNAVPPRKMELCKFWMMDCCAKREKCLYLHNDFPCKFYHTGLVCKAGLKGQCKFSHKPLNDVTKAVLLKHIETAPKEILGDFPRLNRQGAVNLIAKMEAKINAELAREKEREEMDHRRRTRWEVPTRDDQQKLHELMEEAGIGNLYEEAVQEVPKQSQPHHHSRSHHSSQPPPNNSVGMLGIPPPMGIPPPGLGILPNSVPQPNVVNNPALANVLANLHIPSTTIRPPPPKTQNPTENDRGLEMDTRSRSPEQKVNSDEPPEHLPPVQKEIYKRLQEQQKRNDNKTQKNDQSDEEKPDESGWYSSDEESDKPITAVLKEVSEKSDADKKPPVVDFASVLSAIRKNAAAAGLNASTTNPTESLQPDITGRGDVDFRFTNTSSHGNSSEQPAVSSKQGPFGDMDFRVPALRPEFKDIDLRHTGSPTNPDRRSPSLFKSLPTGPATMIDASISSHPPMTWKVHVVGGFKKPDYNYVRHTLTAAQIALDPRFGPRTGGISILPDPSSSPPSKPSSNSSLMSPATIPGGDLIMDPRMSRRGASSVVSDPRISGDPRSVPVNPNLTMAPQPATVSGTNILPPNLWSNSSDMSQAALAAQFMAASQLGLLGPYPNAGGIPFAPPDFGGPSGMPGNNAGGLPPGLRPGFHGAPRFGPGSVPPSSSWERYHSQQQSGGLTPPI